MGERATLISARLRGRLDPLLRRSPTDVEAHDVAGLAVEVGDDETDVWEQLPRAPLHLRPSTVEARALCQSISRYPANTCRRQQIGA